MSQHGLDVFDKTMQATHIWLNEIGETVGPDTQRQYHALRCVLFALRDRLTVEEAFHLSAHLPMLLRGIYWESYRPAGKPETYGSREEFLEHVSRHMSTGPQLNPEETARAVLGVIMRHVPEGEVDDIRHMMPAPVQELFPIPHH